MASGRVVNVSHGKLRYATIAVIVSPELVEHDDREPGGRVRCPPGTARRVGVCSAQGGPHGARSATSAQTGVMKA